MWSAEGWFKVGAIEVTSTVAVVVVGALGLLASVVSSTVPYWLAYAPQFLFSGQVWRLVTWPFADQIGMWSALNLVMLWFFGSELERQTGKRQMALIYAGAWAGFTAMWSLLGMAFAGPLYGMQIIELAVLLLWIAEYPTRRFLFNVPAWGFGAFILGLQVLTMTARRDWGGLLTLLAGLAVVAVVAKRQGLLAAYDWIPGARASARGKLRVVRPPHPSRGDRRAQQRREAIDKRLDELLEKISKQGIDSLTKAERAELDKLSQQRRR